MCGLEDNDSDADDEGDVAADMEAFEESGMLEENDPVSTVTSNFFLWVCAEILIFSVIRALPENSNLKIEK